MLNEGWDRVLKNETEKDYFKKLMDFTEREYASKTVYPPKECIFNAFKYTDYDDVKVLLLGQDPYHEKGSRACFFGKRRRTHSAEPCQYVYGA